MKPNLYFLTSILAFIFILALPSQVQAGCCKCVKTANLTGTTTFFNAYDEDDCSDKCAYQDTYYPDKIAQGGICVDAPEVCIWNERHALCEHFNTAGLKLYSAKEAECLKVKPKPKDAQGNSWVVKTDPCCCFKGDSAQAVLFEGRVNTNQSQPTGWGSSVRDWATHVHIVETPQNPLAYANYQPENVIGRIISVAMTIMGSIALVMFIYGGFVWMTAAGDSAKVSKAVHILVWSTLGLIVIFLAYILTNLLFDIASKV